MLLQLLASATIGGIIGYSTNWVAIKMLFRPLTEKRLGGIRLPFTPGVIPRQRKALAKSIGNAVGAYLITSESLKNSSDSDVFAASIASFIEQTATSFKLDTRTCGELLNIQHNQDLPIYVAKSLSNYTQNYLNNPANYAAIINYIEQKLTDFFAQPLNDLLPNDSNRIENSIANFLENLLASKDTQEFLEQTLEQFISQLKTTDSSLGELFNEEIRNRIKIRLEEHTPLIINKLTEILNQTTTKELIQKYLKNFFSTGLLGSLLNSFLSPPVLTETIITQLTRVLNDEQTQPFIAGHLEQALNALYNMPVKNLIDGIGAENIQVQLTVWIKSQLNQGTCRTLSNYLSKMLTSHQDSIAVVINRLFNLNIVDLGTAQISKILRSYLKSDKFYQELHTVLQHLTSQLLQLQINTVAKHFDSEKQRKVTEFSIKISKTFIEKYGLNILKALDVPSMVENQVNKLDILEVEEIILSVMRTQLKAITNFGLLLGAILGLIMPFLNSFLSQF